MTAIFVYIVCSSAEEAGRIGSHLVENRLAACANIFAPHRSIYRWQGKVENAAETAMIVKTQEEMFEQVRAVVCSLHSYECPCVVALPVTAGHEPYLQWIVEQTS